MKKLLFSLIVSSFFIGCQSNQELDKSASFDEIQEDSDGYSSDESKNGNNILVDELNNRKVIWTANLEFQVRNVEKATSNIKEIANKHKAFVSNMNLTSGYSRISNTITIRVANSCFDSLLNDIKGESIYMNSIKINSKDVTEEFVDIQSRLKAKKEVRERYIKILREKTGDVKDIIEAEEAIRKITEEIEAKEGRLRYLTDKVKFSTITINIYQEVEYKKEPNTYIKPYSEKITDGFKNGWSIITGLVLGLVNIWPIVVIFAFLVWKRKWIISKLKK